MILVLVQGGGTVGLPIGTVWIANGRRIFMGRCLDFVNGYTSSTMTHGEHKKVACRTEFKHPRATCQSNSSLISAGDQYHPENLKQASKFLPIRIC